MTLKKKIFYNAVPGLLFLLIIYIICIFTQYFDDWDSYLLGIYPRHLEGLKGIIFAPLLHKDWAHILSNTISIFVLLWLTNFSYSRIGFRILIYIWLISGFVTWLIGRESHHIGASSLIYGYAFFLIFSGAIRKNRKLAALALLSVFLYGSLVWNMTPLAELIKPSTSWEGHLSGAIAGLVTSILLRKEGPADDPVLEDNPEEEDIEDAEDRLDLEEEAKAVEDRSDLNDDAEDVRDGIQDKIPSESANVDSHQKPNPPNL